MTRDAEGARVREWESAERGRVKMIRCVDGFMLDSAEESGTAFEACACVHRGRDVVYFVNTEGVLRERSCAAPGRVVRTCVPYRMRRPTAAHVPVPTALAASGNLVCVAYRDGSVVNIDAETFTDAQSSSHTHTHGGSPARERTYNSPHKDSVTAAEHVSVDGRPYLVTVDVVGLVAFWDAVTGRFLSSMTTSVPARCAAHMSLNPRHGAAGSITPAASNANSNGHCNGSGTATDAADAAATAAAAAASAAGRVEDYLVLGVQGGLRVYRVNAALLREKQDAGAAEREYGEAVAPAARLLHLTHSSSVDAGVAVSVLRAVPRAGEGRVLWGGGDDGAVRVFEVVYVGAPVHAGSAFSASSYELFQTRLFEAHAEEVSQIVHAGTTVWTSGLDGTLAVWDSETFHVLERKKTEDASVVTVVLPIAAHQDLSVWSTTSSGAVSMWRTALPVPDSVFSVSQSAAASAAGDEEDGAGSDGAGLSPARIRREKEGGTPSGVIEEAIRELNEARELQMKLGRENEAQKGRIARLEHDLADAHARREVEGKELRRQVAALKETQDHNMSVMQRLQDEKDELQKRLDVCADVAFTPAGATKAIPAMPASNKNESFVVATRRSLVQRLVTFVPEFEALSRSLSVLDEEVQKVLQQVETSEGDDIRAYIIRSASNKHDGHVAALQRAFASLVDDFLLTKEKQEHGVDPALHNLFSLAADRKEEAVVGPRASSSAFDGRLNLSSVSATATARDASFTSSASASARTVAARQRSMSTGSAGAGGGGGVGGGRSQSPAYAYVRSPVSPVLPRSPATPVLRSGRSSSPGASFASNSRIRAATPPARLRAAGGISAEQGPGGRGRANDSGPYSMFRLRSSGYSRQPSAPKAYVSPPLGRVV